MKGAQSTCADAYANDGTDTAPSFTGNLWFGFATIAADARALKAEPLFQGAGDLHLKDGSPAIDAAVGSTTKDDYDARPRSLPDLGALER